MEGVLLNGRYELKTQAGQGGMGTVYRAYDTALQRPVAVKVLNQTGLDSAGEARLLHEARAAAQLDHPNIVSVHDVGEADGTPFLVMRIGWLPDGRLLVVSMTDCRLLRLDPDGLVEAADLSEIASSPLMTWWLINSVRPISGTLDALAPVHHMRQNWLRLCW